MKKKLLTILLSALMITTTFVANVFADLTPDYDLTITPITKDDLSNLPYELGNIKDVPAGIIPGTFTFYLFNSNDVMIAYYKSGSWKKSDGNDYGGTPDFSSVCYVIEEVDIYPEGDPFEESPLIRVNNDIYLKRLLYSDLHIGLEGYVVNNNTLYINIKFNIAKTIADILPSDFPIYKNNVIPENAWLNDNGAKVYIEEDKIKFVKDINVLIIDLGKYVMPDGNDYINTDEEKQIKFVMQNDKLVKIQVSNYDSAYNGSYIDKIKIADILNTAEGGFPTTEVSGWVNEAGRKSYVDSSYIHCGWISTTAPSHAIKNADGNYEYGTPGKFTFVIESGKLVKIILSGSDNVESNGEYTPYRFTNDSVSVAEGYTGDIEFVTNGKYVDQTTTEVKVSVDNNPLTYNTDYEVSTGSTHVKLKGSFVSTLAVGTHTIKISMTGYDDIASQFTITGSTPTPSSNTKTAYKAPKTGVE